jgi:hypothetical protein
MKKLLVFLALAAGLDVAGGALLGRLYRRTLTGENGGVVNYALTQDADVLVLGSSRARHHFDPKVLGERLFLRVYNAGLDGHEFLYGATLFDLWQRSHPAPRAVLVHVDAHSLTRHEEELQKATLLAPYVEESARAREVLEARDPYERVKLLSHLYRYNGKALPILKNLLARPAPGFDGFVPLTRTLDAAHPDLTPHEEAMRLAERPFWDLKIRYLDEMAAWCDEHHARLVLVHSPAYREDREAHDLWTERLSQLLASRPGVELVDIGEATHPEWRGRADLYDDAHHLNARGAALFSAELADELRARALRPPMLRRVSATRP